jgi:hypothetical protein
MRWLPGRLPQHVSGNAVYYFVGFGVTDDLVESMFHRVEKPFCSLRSHQKNPWRSCTHSK